MSETDNKLMTAAEIKEVTDTKVDNDFNKLDSLQNGLSGSDLINVRRSGVNYKLSGDDIAPSPLVKTITVSEWSGSGSDYYVTVVDSKVGTTSILIPSYDHSSEQLLQGAVWCVPASGSFTIHTSAVPTGSVTIAIWFKNVGNSSGFNGSTSLPINTNNKSTLRTTLDVYSKSETNSAIQTATNLIPINKGGTNATTAAKAKANLGLGTETENFGLSNSSGSQALVLSATVDNSANTALNGHKVLLVMQNKGIALFDSTAQSAVWNISLPLSTDNGGTGAETVADARTKLNVYSKSETNSAINTSIQNSYGLHGTTRVFDKQLNCPASYGYIQSSAFDLSKDGLYRFEAFWNAAAPKDLYIRKGATTSESQCVAYGVKPDNNNSIIVYCFLTAGHYYLYGTYQSASTNQFICDLFY